MKTIFEIKNTQELESAALETFFYQYEHTKIYRRFVNFLRVNPADVTYDTIPFLPIEMFKKHKILAENCSASLYFESSGTTKMNLSRHYITDEMLYQESIYRSFDQFIGAPEDYIFLGLLPSYLEKQHSSLIYMVDFLMKKSGKKENGYFLYNHQDLYNLLKTANHKNVILFGVSFALLDFLDFCVENELTFSKDSKLTVIETGGMKGRKEEMTKDELLAILRNGFATERIFSEYSMTELLSQAYSLGENTYECPPWMQIKIRNAEDPFSYEKPGKTGAVNIIDLANRHTCSFIATQDLGKILPGKMAHFQILGRIDHSDIRGCSLLVS